MISFCLFNGKKCVFVTLAVAKGLTMAGAPSAAAVGEAGV